MPVTFISSTEPKFNFTALCPSFRGVPIVNTFSAYFIVVNYYMK